MAGLLAGWLASGVRASEWVATPYLDVSVSYDSNVARIEEEGSVADAFSDLVLGLEALSSKQSYGWVGRGGLALVARRHARESSRDLQAIGADLRLRLDGERQGRFEWMLLAWHTDAGIEPVGDRGIDLTADAEQEAAATRRARRDAYESSVLYEKPLSDKTRLRSRYRLRVLEYDEPGMQDSRNHGLDAGIEAAVSDKSALFAKLHAAYEDQYRDGAAAQTLGTRLGFRSRGSDKLVAHAGLGLETYRRQVAPTPGPERDPDGADRTPLELSLSMDLAATWAASDKVTLTAGLNNGHQLSAVSAGNAMAFINGWIGAAYGWTPQTSLVLRGAYRHDQYLDPVMIEPDTPRDRRDHTLSIATQLDAIAPSGRWRFYARLAHEQVLSTITRLDHQTSRLTIGCRVVY